MGRKSKEKFLQQGPTDGHKTHAKLLLVIREMQIKATKRYHITMISTWNCYYKKCLQIINTRWGVEKREWSYTFSGNVNWYSH